MSRHVASLVYRKRLGSIARKAIMAYCAERSNDDGSGIWASKVTISKEVECSRQTVIDTMRNFVTEGLMFEVGKRKCQNGFVVEYSINVAAIRLLPDAISEEDLTGPILDTSSQLTPRGQAIGPQEVKPVDINRPRTVLKPSIIARDGEVDLFKADEAPEAPVVSHQFDQFWDAFPKRSNPASKKNTKARFIAALKQVPFEALLRATKAYAASREGEDPQFTKGPEPWLNGQFWEHWMAAEQSEIDPARARLREITRQANAAARQN